MNIRKSLITWVVDVQSDPYQRLRPLGPTPDDETCYCPPGTGVILRDGLSRNPLFCMSCNGEVPPERLGFGAELAEGIASWLSAYDSLYRLWLDSGDFEGWASARLSDPLGQVNRRGREIVARLGEFDLAYYWWFVDTEGTDPDELTACPLCAEPLSQFAGRRFRECSVCRILV